MASVRQRQLEEITEQLTVQYYADCGTLSTSSKTEEPNPVFETAEKAEAKSLSVLWTSPAEATDCHLWFVAEDGRAGTGRLEVKATVK